jgi:hypothetical protein
MPMGGTTGPRPHPGISLGKVCKWEESYDWGGFPAPERRKEPAGQFLAEEAGFEPAVGITPRTLSRRMT